MIVMASLLGEYPRMIAAHLGEPVSKDYVRTTGLGVDAQTLSGNTYETPDGTYLVDFDGGKAIFIDFTPKKAIKFEKALLERNGRLFDHEFVGKGGGMCSVYNRDNFVDGVKIYRVEFNCSYRASSMQFYGENGKLVQIQAELQDF